MPDIEKVINGLQKLHGSQETMELISDALSLLKEQEAVKPFIQISEHTGKKWLTCGACEYPIESEKDSWEEVNFCPKCGRPILWEGR